ncbi:MAG: acyl-CoA dehydrogenase family protein [Bacteroidetes bacterium]|nr:acyl-CoA dehydrogenase family protein [Bacteroidota bacterium]
MNPFLTEEHELVRNSVRCFAEQQIKPQVAHLDAKEEFSLELTLKAGQLGLYGMTVPESYGGHGMDFRSFIIAIEELARVDSSQAATLAANETLGIWPILNFGNEEQKKTYLPVLCSGQGLWAFGLTEPNAGSDSRGTKTKAVLSDDIWEINGSKIFITNGNTEITKGATVQTITEDSNGEKLFTCFLVEQGTPGYYSKTMKGKMMWRASNTAEMYFTSCKINKDQVLGNIGDGSKIMLSALDIGKLAIAAMGLGLSQGCFEMALKYSKERKQFGQPISKFQAISFKLAEMAKKIELARNTLYKACWLKDNSQPFSYEGTIAKLYCSEIAKEISDEAVQIFGGYGLMNDYHVERFYRDQRLLQIGEGTSEIQRLIIARKIGC